MTPLSDCSSTQNPLLPCPPQQVFRCTRGLNTNQGVQGCRSRTMMFLSALGFALMVEEASSSSTVAFCMEASGATCKFGHARERNTWLVEPSASFCTAGPFLSLSGRRTRNSKPGGIRRGSGRGRLGSVVGVGCRFSARCIPTFSDPVLVAV
eukprot:2775119-Rhodomonas_salina.1